MDGENLYPIDNFQSSINLECVYSKSNLFSFFLDKIREAKCLLKTTETGQFSEMNQFVVSISLL